VEPANTNANGSHAISSADNIAAGAVDADLVSNGGRSTASGRSRPSTGSHCSRESAHGSMGSHSSNDDLHISLSKLMDPTPYCVGPNFPVRRIYPLFIGQHPISAVCVTRSSVSTGGSHLVGILTRRDLTQIHTAAHH
jgi:hypothetical protein